MSLALCGITPRLAFAQSKEECTLRMVNEMHVIHAKYRSVLFGSTGSNILLGSTGSDILQFEDGEESVSIPFEEEKNKESILKTGGITDKDHVGIFETKYRMTSELIEPAVESYRVFRCNMKTVCQTLEESFFHEGDAQSIRVQALGCATRNVEVYTECAIGSTIPVNMPELREYCARTTEETFAHERAVLRLAVAYDTGYRAILQLTGMFDAFVEQVPTRTFVTFRQMVGLLGQLHRVPCFLGHCDMPPHSSSSSSP